MAPLMIKISGEIFVPHLGTSGFQLPFDVTIEFTATGSSSAGGWIGSAPVGTSDHKFELLTSYPAQTNEQANYAVYRGTQLIQQGQTAISNFQAGIQLTEASYNKLEAPEQESYATVSGKVTLGDRNISAVPISEEVATIHVNKVMFRDEKELAVTTIDEYGNYNARIPLSSLIIGNNETDCCKETVLGKIVVHIKVGGDIVASSAFVELTNNCNTIDLHVDIQGIFQVFLTEFESTSRLITKITGLPPSEFRTIGTYGPDSEQEQIIAASGLPREKVVNVINACINAYSLAIPSEHSYAIAEVKGGYPFDWVEMSLEEVTALINSAQNDWQIALTGNINDTYTKIHSITLQVNSSFQTEDGHTIASLIDSVTGTPGITTRFIELSLSLKDQSADQLWTAIEGQYGAQTRKDLQQGMQLLAITGMQPEISKEVTGSKESIPLSKIATDWSSTEWYNLVDKVCRDNNKLCVPVSIRGAVTDPDNTEIKTLYAEKLQELTSDVFATAILGDRIGKGQISEDVIANPAATALFIRTNPDFDLRLNNIWELDLETPAFGAAVRQDLIPVQNIIRVIGGNPAAAVELLNDKIKSSADIVALSQDDFVSKYSGTLNGTLQAQKVYTNAVQNNLTLSGLKTTIQPNNYVTSVLPAVDWAKFLQNPDPATAPDLETLFGSMDLCSCSECMSMYSPAAYYTDLMNFVKNKLGDGQKAFTEADRRRKDLSYIDLTCKNSNTAIPYIDLVNEILELVILKSAGITPPFLSYQTSGTAEDLAAYPEHTYRNTTTDELITYDGYEGVYNTTLRQAVYPNILPFDLPVEESRTYFQHLGFPRYELMQQFKPQNYLATTGAATINEYNIFAEWLGLTKTEADIITDVYGKPPNTDDRIFYGYTLAQTGDWKQILCNGNTEEPGLKALLKRANVSFKELTQLLSTDFLNKRLNATERTFSISSADNASCQLDKLFIKCHLAAGTPTDNARIALFNKMHRFIRMQKATGWSIYQLDMVLSALNTSILQANLSIADFIRIAKTHQLSKKLNTTPERLSAFWSKISTQNYININSEKQIELPSLYDRLFNNKSVLNTINQAFIDPEHIEGSYRQQAGTIVAAFNIKEEELFQLLAFLGINPDALPVGSTPAVSLSGLGRIYGLAQIASGTGLSIKDLIRLLTFTELDGTSLPGIDADDFGLLESIVNNINTLSGFIFSQDELEYLIAHKDAQGTYITDDASIQLFYETLRSELKKLIGDTATLSSDVQTALRNVVILYFSAYFNTDGATAQYLGDIMVAINPGSLSLFSALTLPEFINALDVLGTDPTKPLPIIRTNSITAFQFAEIFKAFEKIRKIVLVLNRFKINARELEFFYTNATKLDVLQMNQLPIDSNGPTLSLWQGLQKLNDWIKVKGKLNLRSEEFLALLTDSLGTQSKDAWITTLTDLTGWNKEDIQFLAGSTNTNPGNLDVIYSAVINDNDFRKGALVLQLANIMDSSKRIGLNPSVSYQALRTDLVLATSRTIRKAAKAKHTETAWLKIAKPLQDTLREKQRKSMVTYIVAKGYTLINGNLMKWNNENDLFAYLLIDVEMQPCMKTSRIKQGISSLQLYMDRVILNLENTNGQPTNHITISPEMTEQWKAWRKWYRIWEANRKIFLYPENWIEPELRDDKTPFFKDLETQLLQDEVKDNTVEDAYRAYLEKLEEVGRLEPVSTYQQLEKDASGKVIIDRTHVFAQTSSLPRRFFYRFLENNEWSPWERVNADIKSDHIVPVIWNRKLYLFWLTFKKKQPNAEEGNDIRNNFRATTNAEWLEMLTIRNSFQAGALVSDPKFSGYSNWEITLNWSQYKEGKWLATEMSNDQMAISIPQVLVNSTDQSLFNDITKTRDMLAWLTNRGEIPLEEFFKNRLYLHQTFDAPGFEDSGVNFSILFAPGLSEIATGIHGFFWRGDNSQDPVVIRGTERGYQIMAPTGTRFNKMKFVEDPKQDGKLRKDNTSFAPGLTVTNKYYSFSSGQVETLPGLIRGANNILLDNSANGSFKVTARAGTMGDPHYHFHNPMLNDFLFEDTKNTFFVRWEPYLSISAAVSTVINPNLISFSATSKFVETAYPTPGNITINVPQFQTSTSPVVQVANAGGYRFHTFYHTTIHELVKALNKDGVPGLLKIENQWKNDSMLFPANYQPTAQVHSAYPKNTVQFGFSDAYSIYNWELFFHAPMLIAQRLMDNQQFEEAQKWYHYIFNPTSNTDKTGISYTGLIKRFWKFYPFYLESEQPVETLYQLLQAINAGNAEAKLQVTKWEQNPFKPHVIARMRILAYMKNVLMKYLDNLIAWGDQLFRRDTIESINEATQLYILASNLLGNRPQEIPARSGTDVYNFDQLNSQGLDALSNSMVNIEAFFGPNSGTPVSTSANGTPYYGKMFYFCLPKNDKLMAYWDTVADRLFKIRNCMNIEGSVRQLPLFEPPIDPALLVRATALGVDVNSILDTAGTVTLPHYRFSYMMQKTNEFCNEVRGLGNSLLSALEKKDAEQIALLRSGQEIRLLEKVKFVKEQQVSEAEANLEAMRLTKENTLLRQQYYSSRLFMNSSEQKHLQSIQIGLTEQVVQAQMQATASTLSLIPQFHLQALASGSSFGGQQLSAAMSAVSTIHGISSIINNAKGSMAATLGGYERRRDDWNFQADTAAKDLDQVDQQILAAEIRLDIAKKDLANHELQMENTSDLDSFMRSKFTNTELYSWTITQVAATYFQSYQLAYDLAKKTEACYKLELPIGKSPVGNFIKFGYWDSLRKGLMSGEKLQFDLRKMEATYMEENKRELELTKHFSLATINPLALLKLKQDGNCIFDLDQTWYDLDFPGHYLRRIKSVSISIPCIAGPYTTIASKLTLTGNSIQKDPADAAVEEVHTAIEAIATSTGQNDSGMFELNFRDERYIPFENVGAVSSWTLDMMDEKSLRQFDYETITDVIIHVRYTARNDDSLTNNKAITTKASLLDKLSNALSNPNPDHRLLLPRYFSLKHEFSNEWYEGFNKLVAPEVSGNLIGHQLDISIQKAQFPEYVQDKKILVQEAYLYFKKPANANTKYNVSYNGNTISTVNTSAYAVATINLAPGFIIDAGKKLLPVTLYQNDGTNDIELNESDLSDVFLLINYKLQA